MEDLFSFFQKIEEGSLVVHLPELVLFQSFFVLTSHYKVPAMVVADKLAGLVAFRGMQMSQKETVIGCLQFVKDGMSDIVDAWILAYSRNSGIGSVYSFDKDLRKKGLTLKQPC